MNQIMKEIKWGIRFFLFLIKWLSASAKKRTIVFMVGTPDYSNYGDQAIALAFKSFLKSNFPNLTLIEIYLNQIDLHTEKFSFFLKNHLVFIIGGGFFGNLWKKGYNVICKSIQMFDKSKIIILPQTIYFTNDEAGEECYRKTKNIIEGHPDLTICLRENDSYLFACNKYSISSIYLVPDLALWLKYYRDKFDRSQILFIFRKDKESILKDETSKKVFKLLKKYFINEKVKLMDNSEIGHTYIINRNYKIKKRIRIFQKSKMIVTDRLHGMIFAAITGTPCIAFNNLNNKIGGTYEFIKNNPYIIFNQDIMVFEDNIKKIKEIFNFQWDFDSSLCNDSFTFLAGKIKEKLEDV